MQPLISKVTSGPSKSVETSLKKLASELNLQRLDSMSFEVHPTSTLLALPKTAMAKGIAKVAEAKKANTTAFHVFMGVPKGSSAEAKGEAKGKAKKVMTKVLGAKAVDAISVEQEKSPVRKFVVLEAKEIDGKIVSVTEAHSK